MNILISNSSKEPIYEQIKKQIKESILRGELNEGDLLPSIRQLARDLHISVITTKRAYDDLENEGYIVTVVGKGTFVAGQNRELLRELRLRWIEEKLAEVVAESRALGVTLPELAEMLKLLYEDPPNGGNSQP
jgi:GntR family transcriptional regulator